MGIVDKNNIINIKVLLTLILLISLSIDTFSQRRRSLFPQRSHSHRGTSFQEKLEPFSIGINAGMNTAFGDIKEKTVFPVAEEIRLGYGLAVNYQLSSLFSVELQGIYGNLAGVKSNFLGGAPANLKFEAKLMEIAVVNKINFVKWLAPELRTNSYLNVYGFWGLGMIKFRTKLYNTERDELINFYGYDESGNNKDKMLTKAVWPTGLGVKAKVTDNLSIFFESSFRHVVSDKLDGFIRVTSFKDKYNYTGIGLIYNFGKEDLDWEEYIPGEKYIVEQRAIIRNLNRKISSFEDMPMEMQKNVDSLTASIEQLGDRINYIEEHFEIQLEKRLDEELEKKFYEELGERLDEELERRLEEQIDPAQVTVDAQKILPPAAYAGYDAEKTEVQEEVEEEVEGTRISPPAAFAGRKYTIQIFALQKRRPIEFITNLENVMIHTSKDGWHRYSVGEFDTYSEAKDYLEQVKAMGYKDAVIRTFDFYKYKE